MLKINNNKNCNIKINDNTISTSSAKEMFEKLGYELINDKKIIYKIHRPVGRITHIAFFDDKQILITQSIGLEELQAINKQVEELHWYE